MDSYASDTTILKYDFIDHKFAAFSVSKHYIIAFNMYDKWNVYNTGNNVNYNIAYSPAIMEKLYQNYYTPKEYTEKYPNMQRFIKDLPNIKPAIKDVEEWDGKNIAINYRITDYKLQGADTVLRGGTIVAKYDLVNQKTLGYYRFDTSVTNSYFIWDIAICSNRIFVQGVDKKDQFCLYEVVSNEQTHSFRFKQMLVRNIPSHYTALGVREGEQWNICLQNGLMGFHFDYVIHDLNKKKIIPIPINKNAIYKPLDFRIVDLHYADGYYYVLCIQDKDVNIVKFKENSKQPESSITVGNYHRENPYSFRFYNSPTRIICKFEKEDHLIIRNVSYTK